MFHAIAVNGTIAGAARALGYTPSAVSQHLAALERETGVALVERSNRGVRLTTAGSVLARRSGAVLDQVRTVFDEVAHAAGPQHTTVAIAAFPTAIPTIVLPTRFALAPAIELAIVDAEPEDALRALEAHDVDCAVTDGNATDLRPTDLHRTLLRKEPTRLVIPTARGPVTRLQDCRDDVWVLGGQFSRHGHAARQACRAAGYEPRVIAETEDHRIAFDVVRATRAVTLLPELALVELPAGIAVAWQVGIGHVRRVEFVTRTTLRTNPAVTAVREALRRHLPPDARSAAVPVPAG